MIDIIALLIATAVIDSPLSHTSAAATSSALKSTISAPAPMTPEHVLKSKSAFMRKALIMNMGSQKPLIRTLADKFFKRSC